MKHSGSAVWNTTMTDGVRGTSKRVNQNGMSLSRAGKRSTDGTFTPPAPEPKEGNAAPVGESDAEKESARMLAAARAHIASPEGKGAAGWEGTEEELRVAQGLKQAGAIDSLVEQLAAGMVALVSGINGHVERTGGLPRLKPSTKRGPVTTNGIRAADAALARKAADAAFKREHAAAKASDAAFVEAFYAQSAAMGDRAMCSVRWDARLGLMRPDRHPDVR